MGLVNPDPLDDYTFSDFLDTLPPLTDEELKAVDRYQMRAIPRRRFNEGHIERIIEAVNQAWERMPNRADWRASSAFECLAIELGRMLENDSRHVKRQYKRYEFIRRLDYYKEG
jgi:hypothetical protein